MERIKKYIVIFIAFVCSSNIAYAQQRTASEVRAIAASQIKHIKEEANKANAKRGAKTMVNTEPELKLVNNDEAYYIFNAQDEAGGFVIVSGDERMPEVLGYSETSMFAVDEELPDGLVWLLGTYYETYQALKNDKNLKLDHLLHDDLNLQEGGVPSLIKTKWHQGEPFNNLCPKVDLFRQASTGCGATAMAQVMNKYKYPLKGRGAKAYSTNTHGFELMSDFSATTFSWELILDRYTDDDGEFVYTTEAGDAIAQLLYTIGIAIETDYGKDGTESESDLVKIVQALPTYFLYDQDINFQFRNYCTERSWNSMIIDELNNNRPIIYRGKGDSGAHIFILDGYSVNNYDILYHFNWGWNGAYDTYYKLISLTPGSHDFSFEQAMVIGIQPEDEISLPCCINIHDLSVSNQTFFMGSQELLPIEFTIVNNSFLTWNGNVQIIAISPDAQYLLAEDNLSLPFYKNYLFHFSCPIKELLPGNYNIIFKYSTDENKSSYIQAELSDACEIQVLAPAVTASLEPGHLSQAFENETITYILDISNNSQEPYTGTIKVLMSQGDRISAFESDPFAVSALSCAVIPISGRAKDFFPGNVEVSFVETAHDCILCTSEYEQVSTSFIFNPAGTCGDNVTWQFDTETGKLAISGTGAMDVYTAPSSVPWDGFRSLIKEVEISDGVTWISNYVFQDCDNLSSVSLPDGVTFIGWSAFQGCKSLESINLPSKLTNIGKNAFSGDDKLTSLTIPASVTTIGDGAFSECRSLSTISFLSKTPPETQTFSFTNLASKGTIYISSESVMSDWEKVKPYGWTIRYANVCNVVLDCGNHGIASLSSSSIATGSVVTLTITPDEGYELDNVTANGIDVTAQVENGLLNIIVTEDTSIKVSFNPIIIVYEGECGVGLIWRFFPNEGMLIIRPLDERDSGYDEVVHDEHFGEMYIFDTPPWVEYASQIEAVSIFEGVKTISDNAFDGCTKINTIISYSKDVPVIVHDSKRIFTAHFTSKGTISTPEGSDYSEWTEQLPEDWKKEKNDWSYEAPAISDALKTAIGCALSIAAPQTVGIAWSIISCLHSLLTACDDPHKAAERRGYKAQGLTSTSIIKSGGSASYISDFQEKAIVVLDEYQSFYNLMVEFFGSEEWMQYTTGEEIVAIFEAISAAGNEELDADDFMQYKPKNISEEELEIFIDRVNNSRLIANNEPACSLNYIHGSNIVSNGEAMVEAEKSAQEFGYEDVDEMWEQEFSAFAKEVSDQSSSVCATITLQFTQKLVMTRQAFRGTLTVFNGHEESPMRDVRLNLVVSDKQGHVATSHEFQINGQSLKGFAGEVDLGSGWTLDAQATGEATILFIPTKYAAPTEPIEYSFGGTLTYIDPFTDLEVTRDLYPVTLTVKPSPNLDLTYFMQRDIMGDNALTTDVVEPMVPAEFALLIHNDGYGDATDVRMTTEQPKIVENEKGLLIDFELLSSQVNGKDKVMALGGSVPADFGTIPAHSTAYAQWMLQASLLGHFTDYNVEATHVTSYGNEDLSLLNEVTIHELIHSLSLTDVDGEPLVGWLVNDVTDANDEPDMLYFSNAETTSVNMLNEEQMNMGAVDNDNVSVTLSVGVAQAGWHYGCLVDPMAGRARITAVTRQSDGASIDPQNFWLTEYTLVDGKDPIQEYMLHFADTLSTTYETYTIAFEMLPEEMLSVTAFTLPDKGDSSIYPDYVTTVGITFSKAIDPATFTIDDLKLTCRGKTIDLNGVTLSTEDNTTFTMDLTGLTTEDGYYVLTVQTVDITDVTGYNGQAGKSVDWTQFYGGLLVLRAESQPAEGGSVSYEETAQKAALRRANENGDAQNESVLEVKVPYNSDGALTAQSAEGFGFGGWYMNDQLLSTESRYTSIFIDHTNLTAQFKQLYFDLTVDWNANRGTVTGAGTGKYSYGSNLSLVATPFEGYRFYQWEVNDEVPDDNPGSAYTHTVTGNATLSPLFLAETSSGLLLGDVKEDGNINVGDYTALVSLIVGTDGGRYLLETADHNGNKKADVGDLATEVNMIMDIGSFAANSLRHMGDNGVVQSEFDPDNRLYGPEMTLKAGDEVSVPLFLANKDEVSAFQTDIVLPDGLTLLDVAVAEERTTKLDHNLLVTSSKNGGTIRLLAGSSSNVSYRGTAGAVVMLRLRADEDMEDGEYIYQLKHTVLSSADSQIFHAPDCSMPMRIGNATGILTVSLQAESAKGIYDVAGRKIANEATIDVVNRLPAGVYVVSGRKIVVR